MNFRINFTAYFLQGGLAKSIFRVKIHRFIIYIEISAKGAFAIIVTFLPYPSVLSSEKTVK